MHHAGGPWLPAWLLLRTTTIDWLTWRLDFDLTLTWLYYESHNNCPARVIHPSYTRHTPVIHPSYIIYHIWHLSHYLHSLLVIFHYENISKDLKQQFRSIMWTFPQIKHRLFLYSQPIFIATWQMNHREEDIDFNDFRAAWWESDLAN